METVRDRELQLAGLVNSITSGLTSAAQGGSNVISNTISSITGVSVTAPSPTPASGSNVVLAPAGKCGSPMTVTINSLAEYRVYVDGVLLGYSNAVQNQVFTTTYGSR